MLNLKKKKSVLLWCLFITVWAFKKSYAETLVRAKIRFFKNEARLKRF